MLLELLPSLCRKVLRSFATACLLLIPGSALAQSTGNYCAPAADMKAELKKVAAVSDEEMPFKLRRERQTAMLQALLKKYPNDFHLQKRYQNDRRSGFFVDQVALLADYRALMEKSPNDPGAVYLYARLLVGQKTKEAIEQLDKLVQRTPDFPVSYLQLAEIYNYPNFRDAAKSKENLKLWIAKCPAAMEGFSLLTGVVTKS